MAFRRSFQKFRRSFRRKRTALNWQKAQSPRRWNVGNFNLNTFIQIDDASSLTGEFAAQLVATPSNFLVLDPMDIPRSQDNRQLISSIRRIDVGGLVFTQGIDIVQAGNIVAGTLSVKMMHLWTVNALDTDGFAVGIDYPWGLNGAPITNTGSQILENQDEPLRILDRVTENYSSADISAGLEGPQPIFRFRRSRSLRLKLPIDDKKCLCFTQYFIPNQTIGPDDELVIHSWVTGTIYYKYVH